MGFVLEYSSFSGGPRLLLLVAAQLQVRARAEKTSSPFPLASLLEIVRTFAPGRVAVVVELACTAPRASERQRKLSLGFLGFWDEHREGVALLLG